ncbi:MAG: C4-dicarboxylate transporter DcuC [Deferribacteraceae bacterium]|jgi:DcuC family C4-dicarboxylate transporter|nr:C4-dicarboxylate transporter DcuC [Deferribacteraceae bacterium]
MGTVAVIIGLLIIVGVVYLLLKRVETRLVLLGAGFLMCIIGFVLGLEGASPLVAFNAFSTGMANGSFIQTICSTLGFALVLQLTQCDKHLIYSLARALSKVRWLLIPGVAIATFCVNNALPSAAGCAAAVGVIMIPLLMSQGIHPATAASAVMLGTIGSNLSPGNAHNVNISGIITKVIEDGATDIIPMATMEVIIAHAPAVIASIIIGAGWLTFRAWKTGENKGYVMEGMDTEHDNFKINPILAILPLVPIVLLITFAVALLNDATLKETWIGKFSVPHAMRLGAFLCTVFSMAFNKISPQEATKKFFDGMGQAYGNVIGLILSAGVFVAGLGSLGLIAAFISAMESSDSIVKLASTYGPFLLGVASGSGDAATLAFNNAVTPHAMSSFGVAINKMGSVAAIAGSLGRTMSPLAAAAIICAGIAKVNPFEIAKRNAPGMILASIATMVIMFYFV